MPLRFLLLLTILTLCTNNIWAQEYLPDSTKDSLPADTLQDTMKSDTLGSKSKKSGLEDKVLYSAEDSMMISVTGEKLFLYGNAKVKYMDIDLAAAYIELDLSKEEVYARGAADTSGNVIGTPVFKQGAESFESDSMKYNFKTERGIIYNIITQQGEGYLHSSKTKRLENGHIHVKGGKYTTCDATHPHFYMYLTKAIMIPEEKIITGPAYLVVEDIPIKVLGIPYGFFPITSRRASGIIIPDIGEESKRGFYMNGGGWYQVIGEHADFSILEHLYSRGAWGITANSNYKWRYRFNGNFQASYRANRNIDEQNPTTQEDYMLYWHHRQDPKSNPTRNFSANVNFTSSKYNVNNSTNLDYVMQNQKSSSISFTKQWGTLFNLSLSADASQNTRTSMLDMRLPAGSLNMNTIYPLRKKNGSGKYRWYENISLSYSSDFENQVHATDTDSFEEVFDTMSNGFSHSIPLAVNFKLGKMITITPSLNYEGRIYTKKITSDSAYYVDSTHTVVKIFNKEDEVSYAHAINPTISIRANPKLYGMYLSKRENSRIVAVRHVLTPSAGISFTPDMRKINPDYYDSLIYTRLNYNGTRDSTVHDGVYCIYQDEIYSPPSSYGKVLTIPLSLSNNLEMKLRPKDDSAGSEPRKVSLIDNLSISTGYHPFYDKFKWDDINISGSTRLFKEKLNISSQCRFSLYDFDSISGAKIDEFYWKNKKQLMRFQSITFTAGITFRSSQGKKSDESKTSGTEEETEVDSYYQEDMTFRPGSETSDYVDFDIPWSLTFDYSWSYSKPGIGYSRQQTVNIRGDLSITPKWKVNFSTAYDIETEEFSTSRLMISRDLHCWQMGFEVIPFGRYRNYSFRIAAKSSLLSDLKYEQRSHWYDNF